LISAGKFPRPVQLGIRTVGWPEREVDEFVETRIAERDARTLKKLGFREPTTDAERGAVARDMIRKISRVKLMEVSDAGPMTAGVQQPAACCKTGADVNLLRAGQ